MSTLKFVGVNSVRLNRATVERTLIEAFSEALTFNDLKLVRMRYHRNGDITLNFEPKTVPKPVPVAQLNKVGA